MWRQIPLKIVFIGLIAYPIVFSQDISQEKWPDFKTTWKVDPAKYGQNGYLPPNSYSLHEQPRTQTEAESKNWALISEGCIDTTTG